MGIHMKLFMNKNEKYEEPEVHMFFHKQTKEVDINFHIIQPTKK